MLSSFAIDWLIFFNKVARLFQKIQEMVEEENSLVFILIGEWIFHFSLIVEVFCIHWVENLLGREDEWLKLLNFNGKRTSIRQCFNLSLFTAEEIGKNIANVHKVVCRNKKIIALSSNMFLAKFVFRMDGNYQ